MNSEAPPHTAFHEPGRASPNTAALPPPSLLRAVGSLWFAAVLLVLLLIAMACATVFESVHGPEQTLATFYHAQWFKLLLGLLAANSLAAIILRFPFTTRHIGFLLTHLSILVILAGALVSERLGVNGQVSIVEGQSVDHFDNTSREVISVTNPRDRRQIDIELDSHAIGGFTEVDRLDIPVEAVGNQELRILRYLPDSNLAEHIADDGPHPNCAIEVSLSMQEHGTSEWIFQNQTASLGALTVGFRMITDAGELARMIDDHPASQPASSGTVRVEVNGSTFDLPLDSCMDKPVAVGETGYTVRVLRYLPHATVGREGQIANASDRPVNPFIEAELSGPGGTENRKAFARFPEFSAMHSGRGKDAATSQPSSENVKVLLVSSAAMGPNTPIEALGAPDGRLYVRYAREDGSWTSRELRLGEPVETPWPGRTFSIIHKYDHARMVRSVSLVTPVRQNRTPAILVKVGGGEKGSEVWLRKDEPQTVEAGDQPWNLTYCNQPLPLGFKLTLNRFVMGLYPGESSPRTFESHISVTDATSGREQNKIVSMNQPVSIGGFSLFQSSYRQGEGKATSVLSVANDPGQPIVFFGYITMLAGMIVVLITRMKDRRRAAAARAAAAQRTER